ncbi:MAG: hypothetical protein ABI647_11445 [Gemmatimonadota bacterium]
MTIATARLVLQPCTPAPMLALLEEPERFEGLAWQLLTYVGLAVDDAGDGLAALAASRAGRTALLARVSISEARLDATLELLEAINYICRSGDEYLVNVPVLLERDRPIVDSTLSVGRDILTPWLGQHVNRMERELSSLSPLRSGLPFSLVFSELWHYVFGFATKPLAESGCFLTPRGAGRVAAGYVPFVWANSFYSF